MTRTKWTLCLTLAVLMMRPVLAQTAGPGSKFQWAQVAADLASANAFSYRAYIDTAAPVVLTATCTGTSSPFTCTAPIPAVTPGSHSVQLTAAVTFNGGFWEGPKSTTVSFTMIAVPGAPQNVTIVP